jgi:hypothetical protein
MNRRFSALVALEVSHLSARVLHVLRDRSISRDGVSDVALEDEVRGIAESLIALLGSKVEAVMPGARDDVVSDLDL